MLEKNYKSIPEFHVAMASILSLVTQGCLAKAKKVFNEFVVGFEQVFKSTYRLVYTQSPLSQRFDFRRKQN